MWCAPLGMTTESSDSEMFVRMPPPCHGSSRPFENTMLLACRNTPGARARVTRRREQSAAGAGATERVCVWVRGGVRVCVCVRACGAGGRGTRRFNALSAQADFGPVLAWRDAPRVAAVHGARSEVVMRARPEQDIMKHARFWGELDQPHKKLKHMALTPTSLSLPPLARRFPSIQCCFLPKDSASLQHPL